MTPSGILVFSSFKVVFSLGLHFQADVVELIFAEGG